MTQHQRPPRLAPIPPPPPPPLPPRRYDDWDERTPAERAPAEIVLEARSWRQAATNAAFAQRGARYGALGPRGRW